MYIDTRTSIHCHDNVVADVHGAPGPPATPPHPLKRREVLGNHTDYNEGYILACAIDRYVVISGKTTDSTVARNYDSVCFDERRRRDVYTYIHAISEACVMCLFGYTRPSSVQIMILSSESEGQLEDHTTRTILRLWEVALRVW